MRNLRNSYIWNTLSTIAYAGMSFLMTLVTIHLCGQEAGGIFSIAFSSSQMLQSVAMFGMRNYQATDVREQFDSGEYISSRIITSFAMAIACGIYAWLMRFETEKRTIYLLFCGVKLFEALADVMEGITHRKNRLDIASQILFLRTVLIIVAFTGALGTGHSLAAASFLAFFMAALGFLLCAWPLARRLERFSISMDHRRVGGLLLQCLPLFLVSAAMAYINNAPKIAIDLNMDDQAQAQFAIIFMPAFVVNLISSFIFRPQLNTMAVYYASKEKKRFQNLVRWMTLVDIGLTLIALGGTYFLGVPVLGWIYQVDISGQKNALFFIVLSSGFCALASLLCQALTVMRRQNNILVGYLTVSVITATLSTPLVRHFEMSGAAMLYFMSMAFLILFLELFYIYYINKTD